jgi:hypothetical protein
MRCLLLATPAVLGGGAASGTDVPKMDAVITLAGNLPALVRASTHPATTMKSYDGGTHGVSLFVNDRELRPAIVKWLQGVVK